MRVLFVASDNWQSRGDYTAKNEKWIKHADEKGNKATVVEFWYTGQSDPLLRNLAFKTDEVYIRGHGVEISDHPSIQVGQGGDVLGAKEVGERLITSGLRKRFQGKLKCYNCHSSELYGAKSDPENDRLLPLKSSFAQAFADYMYNHGYSNCKYFGYEGSVDSFPKDGPDGVHKYRRDSQFDAEKGGVKDVAAGRASENRVRIFPRYLAGMRLNKTFGLEG